MKPFGCHVTILNTLDHLAKFDEKGDEGFFVGYSLTSKASRVYNMRTKRVQEVLHVQFLENKEMIKGSGPDWLFDIERLSKSMNYLPIQYEENPTNNEENGDDFVLMPVVPNHENSQDKDTKMEDKKGDYVEDITADSQNINIDKHNITADSAKVNADSINVIAGSININVVGPSNTTDPLDNQANIEGNSGATDVDDFDTGPDNMPLSYTYSTNHTIHKSKQRASFGENNW